MVKIQKVESRSKRYDLQTKSNNFFANGILVHNSTIILSIHNGEIIARTRGTENSSTQDTGPEVYSLINKYQKILNFPFVKNGNLSVLFEHTTPNRIIVLREHDVPTLTLLGVIYNESAILMDQNTVDKCAELWKIERPKKYSYSTVSECISDVEAWKGKEGVVLYSPDGNTLKKIKAAAYLELHKLATGIKNINQVVDLFMSTEKFTIYEEFYKYVETARDYEIAEKIKDDMLLVVNAYNRVLDSLKKINKFVDGLRGESFSRKDQAVEITKHWSDWRAGVAFKILDNKEIEDKFIKKGIEFYLEKQNDEIQTS